MHNTVNTRLVWSIFTLILSIVLFCLIVYIIIIPFPLKYIIRRINPKSNYPPNSNATITANYTLYSNEGSTHNRLIVVFIGGALLTCEVANSYGLCNYLNEKLGKDYDILLFNYPVRFKNTLHETMLAINAKLTNFVHYDDVHAIGISFGALLAGAFYNKEYSKMASRKMAIPQIGMLFRSLTAFSGLFETKFNASILTTLFKFYIMRKTKSILDYTCYGLPVPKLIINSKSDFLLAQTMKMAESEQCEVHIYESTILPHPFVQFINLAEATDALDRFVKFIRRIDDKQ